MGVFESITDRQISQLLKFAANDPITKKYTHDAKRFKNRKAFNKWGARRFVYTLGGKKGELLGIAWFGKKKNTTAGDAPFTFAIRIYPPLRGKGYSKDFIKEVFKKFKLSDIYKKSKKKGFWLKTGSDNVTAINLYKNFGFKAVSRSEGSIVMVLN